MNSENPKTHYIERLNGYNIADIARLHKAVHKILPVPNFYEHKYETAFTGAKYIGYIAYNYQHVIIGYYGVIPCFVKLGDKMFLSAQSADTMTHPQFRLKGLFVELSQLTFQLCRDSGINLLFGFPNQNSLPGAINKLGWKMTDTMECFIIPIHLHPIYKLFNKASVLKRLLDRFRQNQLKKYHIPKRFIANSVFEDNYGGIFRDDKYFTYKTYTINQFIKIGDAVLWIKISNELLIGDMLVTAGDFDNVMAELKKIAVKSGISQIRFHCTPGTTLHGLFSGRYKSFPSFPVLFQDFTDNTDIYSIKFTSADIDTF